MIHSYAKSRQPQLTVDHTTGELISGPEEAVISRRYIEAHPQLELDGDTLHIGPDAPGPEYRVIDEFYGFIKVERVQ